MQIEKNPLWRAGKHPLLWGCLLLTAVTLLNNWPMAAFGFAWDDHGYVVRNYPIQDPVSLKSLLWCLTAFAEANWHPMTWLALHLQFQLFGFNPGGYHVTNLLLHIANTLLLYALLYRTTRAVGKSLFVAALFSVHPLHIESVAWISEIKDVLSTFFFLLTLHAYASYARRPELWRYGLVGLLLALGLASKPMLVTAPCIMLLLDFWPLGRWTGGPQAAAPDTAGPRYAASRLILEKLPFLAMSVAVCVLTFLAQRDGGAMASLSGITLAMRLSNVANSYVLYLWRMAWPWPLSFFYPYQTIPPWRALSCLAVLAALMLLIWLVRRTKPYLLFGWLWYLGALVPVIGLVQVGAQAMADRYTYIPSIGVFVAIVWLLDDLRKRTRLSVLVPATLSAAAVLVFMCLSLDYLLKWINEEELYSHGLTIDKNNVVALNNYGIVLLNKKDTDNAIENFKKNIEVSPKPLGAQCNLSGVYIGKGDVRTALDYALQALRGNPGHNSPYALIGHCFYLMRDYTVAEAMLLKSIGYSQANLNTVVLLLDLYTRNKQYDQALRLIDQHLSSAYDQDPMKAMMLYYKGKAYFGQGKFEESKAAYDQVLAMHPVFPLARQGLTRIALAQNDIGKAAAELKTSLQQYPNDPGTRAFLGKLYALEGKSGKAYRQLKGALANPKGIDVNDQAETYLAMAALARRLGHENAAVAYAARAHDCRTYLLPQGMPLLRNQLFAKENEEILKKAFPEELLKTMR